MEVCSSVPETLAWVGGVGSIDPPVGNGNLGCGIGLDGRLNYDTEGTASTTTESPEEIAIGNFVGDNKISIGGDNLVFKDLINTLKIISEAITRRNCFAYQVRIWKTMARGRQPGPIHQQS